MTHKEAVLVLGSFVAMAVVLSGIMLVYIVFAV